MNFNLFLLVQSHNNELTINLKINVNAINVDKLNIACTLFSNYSTPVAQTFLIIAHL